jgi:hypothetical protein
MSVSYSTAARAEYGDKYAASCDRAIRNAGIKARVRKLTFVGHDTYTVQSSDGGSVYFIAVVPDGFGGDGYDCTCEAGFNARPCWHTAAVEAARAEIANALASLGY